MKCNFSILSSEAFDIISNLHRSLNAQHTYFAVSKNRATFEVLTSIHDLSPSMTVTNLSKSLNSTVGMKQNKVNI